MTFFSVRSQHVFGLIGAAVYAFVVALSTNVARAEDKPDVCVQVTMDIDDIHLSYRNELQARIDRLLATGGIKHLGVNIKGGNINVLLADVADVDKATALVQTINVPLVLYGSDEFDIVNEGDGRIVVKPSPGAFLEIEEATMAALRSRTKIVSNLKTNGQTKITMLSQNEFLVFAPGIKDMDEYKRPFAFTPGVDLTIRLWPQPKEGEPVVAPKPGSMQPVRRGFTHRRLVLVPRVAFADGRDLVRAIPEVVDGKSGLSLKFSGRGTKTLKAVTADASGDIIAILLSNIIVAEYKIDKPVTDGKLFVPVEETPEELARLADKVQSGGYQPLHKVEPSEKCQQ